MIAKSFSGKKKVLIAAGVCALALLGYWYAKPLWLKAVSFYHLITEREQVKNFVTSFGAGAPVVFVGLQILQVLFAPFPGEATGFIGGFLFGTARGFIYSSIGLTVGSWLNFSIGRFLGERYVRKHIPSVHLDRMDRFVKRQGIIVLFVLFVLPGFPKDYLCLFLGLSAISFKVFMALAVFGRMPGTLMLSLQGAFVFEKHYKWFVLILGLCLVMVFLAYRFRENLYRWLERFNEK
jgi:uncharacterized membrane protein YdjX (TVP38/TMEM64 family)